MAEFARAYKSIFPSKWYKITYNYFPYEVHRGFFQNFSWNSQGSRDLFCWEKFLSLRGRFSQKVFSLEISIWRPFKVVLKSYFALIAGISIDQNKDPFHSSLSSLLIDSIMECSVFFCVWILLLVVGFVDGSYYWWWGLWMDPTTFGGSWMEYWQHVC